MDLATYRERDHQDDNLLNWFLSKLLSQRFRTERHVAGRDWRQEVVIVDEGNAENETAHDVQRQLQSDAYTAKNSTCVEQKISHSINH